MESFLRQQNRSNTTRSVASGPKVNGMTRVGRGIVLKKGGLAKIRLISTAPELRGELRWLLTPRILKSLYGESTTVKKSDRKRKTRRLKKFCKDIYKLHKAKKKQRITRLLRLIINSGLIVPLITLFLKARQNL